MVAVYQGATDTADTKPGKKRSIHHVLPTDVYPRSATQRGR